MHRHRTAIVVAGKITSPVGDASAADPTHLSYLGNAETQIVGDGLQPKAESD